MSGNSVRNCCAQCIRGRHGKIEMAASDKTTSTEFRAVSVCVPCGVVANTQSHTLETRVNV